MKIFRIIPVLLICLCCEKKSLDENQNPKFIFDVFWKELNRHYSFFEYSSLNWDSVYEKNQLLISENTSKEELFQIFDQILDLLNDAHTNVYAPLGVAGNVKYFDKFDIDPLVFNESYFEKYLFSSNIFEYSIVKSTNIGYLKIRTFEGDYKKFIEIDSILLKFNKTNGLIIDVRSNRGGNIINCKLLAGKFADSVRYAGKHRYRNGPKHNDFSDWINIQLVPSKNTRYLNRPIAVLTDRLSYSATEWFIMNIAILPNVILIGDTTGGGSATPIIRELPNGWLLRVSNSQTQLNTGKDFQFIGIAPNVVVKSDFANYLKNIDPVITKAVEVLLSKQK